MRKKGTITFWNDNKGYGFIEPVSGHDRVFVHISSLSKNGQRPAINQQVSFNLSKDKQGRPCAVKVLRVDEKLPHNRNRKRGDGGRRYGRLIQLPLALAFLSYVGKLVMTNETPVEALYAYLGLSLLTFIAYAKDKSAAQNDQWRIREDTLHAFALAGGWPGALIAQQVLRHKSSKGSFRFVFWITVVVNCGVFVWFFTPNGEAQIRALIASAEQLLSF